MNRFLGPYLDHYALLEQPAAAAELTALAERHPWFTLGRYMQLRALWATDSGAHHRLWRQLDARLFAHPYPRILLTGDELGAPGATPSFPSPAAEGPTADYYVPESSMPDSTTAVINDFLLQNFSNRTPASPNAEAPQEDISAPSAVENPEAISETLATIYLTQGRPDRAIDIYYQLSLKYPEKSAYFAHLILQVRQQGYPAQ